jgi:predicted DNA-binding protein with PD1-like motif
MDGIKVKSTKIIMKSVYLFAILLVGGTLLHAQDQMPEVYTVTTEIQRVEIVRLQTGTDMLDGLNKAIKDHSIVNGVILSGIGSVSAYHFHVVSDNNLPPSHEYPGASVAKDLTSVQGYILNGRVHAHITLSDENSVIGGHLEEGTKALTFIIVTIGVLPDEITIDKLDSYTL